MDLSSRSFSHEILLVLSFLCNYVLRVQVPMFFHIPKAGGSTVKDIVGTCHRFIMATETGVTDGHADDQVRSMHLVSHG